MKIDKKIIIELKKYIENKEDYKKQKKGGVLPLLVALAAILAGIGGAAGIAGGVATAVNQAKRAKKTDVETEKVKAELAQLKPKQRSLGAGVYLNPYKGRALYDFLKNTRYEKLPFLKGGEGIYLSSYKKE